MDQGCSEDVAHKNQLAVIWEAHINQGRVGEKMAKNNIKDDIYAFYQQGVGGSQLPVVDEHFCSIRPVWDEQT